ncbi:MAG: DUF4139 domain-containing protein [Tepidisphaeraceae bacterium]
MFRIALALCLTAALSAFAQEPASDFSLTVYSTADPATFDPQELARQQVMNPYARWQYQLPGYGVVRETRKIDLNQGTNTVRFADVASGIDPTSVSFRSLTAPDATAVVEQNYEYDVLNSEKLMEKYIGKDVVVLRRLAANEAPQPFGGKLLSYDGATMILATTDPKQPVMIIPRGTDIAGILLADSGSGLITKPTLVWTITTPKAGKHDAQVTYQTDGLTWRADYNVLVNEEDTAADIGAWVTLLNQSGASYPNSKLKLVAGDVQRVKPVQAQYQNLQFAAGKMRSDAGGFAEKSFFEYHLYTLERQTSIANNSTKQIELFPAHTDVPVSKAYVYYGLPENMRYWFSPDPSFDRNLGTQSNKKVDIYLLLTNSEKNGMGMPLPAGRVRVYKRDDADDSTEFIGEDVIQHTPKDEKVMVRLGSAFDVVGERKQTEFNINEAGHVINESFEIKLRNHKKEPVTVIVKENLYRWTNWDITKSTDKWDKQDYRTIHIPVEVPPDGEITVT